MSDVTRVRLGADLTPIAGDAEQAMEIGRLIKMANDIGAFYEAFPDRAEAINSIATHLKNFWEPRMRREIVDYARRGGESLSEIVRQAVLSLEVTKA